MTRTEKEIRLIIQDLLKPSPKDKPFKESDYDKTIAEMGADSFDVVELVVAIETTFGLEVPDSAISGISQKTPLQLAAMVEHIREQYGPKYKKAGEESGQENEIEKGDVRVL